MSLSERDVKIQLAACRGTLEALVTDKHLAIAVKKYGYVARTFEGDVFEESFIWAREEKQKLLDELNNGWHEDAYYDLFK